MGKRLSFGDLRGVLADAFGKLLDARRGANRQYTMADAAWAARSLRYSAIVQVSWGQETAPRIGESSADKVRLACQQELHDFLARHPRFFGSCKKNAFFSKKKAPEAIWASRADKTLS